MENQGFIFHFSFWNQLQNLLEEGFVHVEHVKHVKHAKQADVLYVLHVLHGRPKEILQLGI